MKLFEGRTPYQISGIVFLIVILIGIGVSAILLLLPPSESIAGISEAIANATLPVAIVAGVIAYFWAKNNQE